MNLDLIADQLNKELDANLRDGEPSPLELHALQVAEEAGEAVGAYRRYSGTARRSGTLGELAKELADVLISTACFARRAGLSTEDIVGEKLTEIYARGWKE
jgi:NTP pyrophosphatase (non-canonical NTP hydrolase)